MTRGSQTTLRSGLLPRSRANSSRLVGSCGRDQVELVRCSVEVVGHEASRSRAAKSTSAMPSRSRRRTHGDEHVADPFPQATGRLELRIVHQCAGPHHLDGQTQLATQLAGQPFGFHLAPHIRSSAPSVAAERTVVGDGAAARGRGEHGEAADVNDAVEARPQPPPAADAPWPPRSSAGAPPRPRRSRRRCE